ncbi:putative sterol desaturase [Aspergillus nomiae NRRL 13137]|uniref:Putative sterol desaturase n=1 Tax=Aspergillus nomiae NRRL (strain ATCC 15546 / NRRL 13137 / CBS 260.88 / M93) TaxID=1509407 RepID=A0A0L1JAL9_ASPN3|nr:putative sterol desaturase [Aspergillus nomiae NRRL 13137]KNG88767.1 putative sterol desaturase [Aspergillus nomiae NRRL 13137]
MDVLLDILDTFVFDRLYASILPATNPVPAPAGTYNKHINLYYPLPPSPYADSSTWKRDDLVRQTTSLFLIGWIFATALYLIGSTLIYHTLFDKRVMRHPHFLPNQIRQEIRQGLFAIPVIAVLTAPFFLAEVRGWTKLYDFNHEAPFRAYNWLQYPLFVCFTDCGIYWIHRGLHYPPVYRWLHKPHHKWIMPSPFASYAFHPLDGWSQSIPYHVYPLLFPLQKSAYLGLFVFVTMWTVFIHDAEYLSESIVVNGAACHTMHHLYFNYNYGQFLTFWDRVSGTYRKPKEDGFIQSENRKAQALKRD